MCLAVPGVIERIGDDGRATVNMMGAVREASLRLVPEAQVGDYILVHAGFGIQIVDADEARETIELIEQMSELVGEDTPAGAGTESMGTAGALA